MWFYIFKHNEFVIFYFQQICLNSTPNTRIAILFSKYIYMHIHTYVLICGKCDITYTYTCTFIQRDKELLCLFHSTPSNYLHSIFSHQNCVFFFFNLFFLFHFYKLFSHFFSRCFLSFFFLSFFMLYLCKIIV